jgi:hypothetical protein
MQLELFPELARETRWPRAASSAGESVYEIIEKEEKVPFQLELFPSTLSPKEYRRYWDNFYPTSEGEPVYEDLG